MKISVQDLAALVGGTILAGPEDRILTSFGSLEAADGDSLSFFGNPKYVETLKETQAGAVLVPLACEVCLPDVTLIGVENPIMAFDVVVRKFGVTDAPFEPGIHPTAWISEDVALDPTNIQVGPGAVIESGCNIGEGTLVGANSTVGRNSVIGKECRLYQQVVLYEGSELGDRVVLHSGAVIGADGYGYEFEEGRHKKILQAGNVQIHNDVEVGANTTIDRARFGSTIIGEGTKIDNQVQIGHNVRIGKHCLIVAQVGISGSSRIGDYVVVAAQSGIAGHLTIADKTTLGGRCGVIANIDQPGGTYFGYPAKPLKDSRRQQMFQKKIPTLVKQISQLEERIQQLEAKG